jgi:hypothetical protein
MLILFSFHRVFHDIFYNSNRSLLHFSLFRSYKCCALYRCCLHISETSSRVLVKKFFLSFRFSFFSTPILETMNLIQFLTLCMRCDDECVCILYSLSLSLSLTLFCSVLKQHNIYITYKITRR